jgi:thiosulfate dehydrogenase
MLKQALSVLMLAVLPPLARANPPADAGAWRIANPDELPDDSFGRTVRHGRDLIVKTSSLIGPDAAEPSMRYAVSGLDCASCHLAAGTTRFGLPLAGIWGIFPQFIARENEVRTREERINGCMQRSLNGKTLPVDGPEMKAMLTYIRFISAGEKTGQSLDGRGTPPLPLPAKAADPAHGALVFASLCAECHGADGQGKRLPAAIARTSGRRYEFPPLWGPDSFNDGAGMNRAITAAAFVHANMPLGVTFETPALSPADAFDVAGFVVSQPRPHMQGLEADYPDRMRKPVDAGYRPFIGPFPPEQHRLGPWRPIQEWIKTKGGVVRTAD